ncbi:beta-ketoacyl-[acyl-carrier-protein] synthase family protein (plasmid) [Streptomyces sp. BI20]|uniref:beta-ketoacyl-[acyl-carrier-protein] synthase family protein n=1 Tax=Streptomyces sp. BI20 TaxID=3403460 RepID=UPI003C7091A6
MPRRRVLVTGMGVIAPGATGVPAFRELLRAGRTAFRPITRFDPTGLRSTLAAEVDFDPAAHGLTPQDTHRLDRAGRYGVAAAREALADSRLHTTPVPDRPDRIGVSVGTAAATLEALEDVYRTMTADGRRPTPDPALAPPHLHTRLAAESLAAEIAWAADAEGPVTVLPSGCTAGLDALGHAADLIRADDADIVLAGAAEAPLTRSLLAALDALRLTGTHNDDPTHAHRPFDATRTGLVLGEGAAVFVLEERERALRRGAPRHAELVGHAGRTGAAHMTALPADGRDLAAALTEALADAALPPEAVDHIAAHGAGTPLADRHEAAAIRRALGPHARTTPVSAISSMVGHGLGALGALQTVAAVLALTHDLVPPTATLRTPDPDCELDHTPRTARPHPITTAVALASGFGGFQSALVLRKPESPRPDRSSTA